MNKKLKIIVLSVVFATAGYAKDTHAGLNKLEMQKVFSSSDVKTMKLDKKEQVDTQGTLWGGGFQGTLWGGGFRPFTCPCRYCWG